MNQVPTTDIPTPPLFNIMYAKFLVEFINNCAIKGAITGKELFDVAVARRSLLEYVDEYNKFLEEMEAFNRQEAEKEQEDRVVETRNSEVGGENSLMKNFIRERLVESGYTEMSDFFFDEFDVAPTNFTGPNYDKIVGVIDQAKSDFKAIALDDEETDNE